jgi:hypothetical protein
MFKITIQSETCRHIKMRKRADLFNFRLQRSAISRVRESVRRVFEDAIHLVVTFHEKLVALELHPVRVLNRLPGLDAHHYVLRVSIVSPQVVAIVGGDQW